MKANGYQRDKARKIAVYLLQACIQSPNCTIAQLPQLAARFNEENWRTVSLGAGVAPIDVPFRPLVVAYLLVAAGQTFRVAPKTLIQMSER